MRSSRKTWVLLLAVPLTHWDLGYAHSPPHFFGDKRVGFKAPLVAPTSSIPLPHSRFEPLLPGTHARLLLPSPSILHTYFPNHKPVPAFQKNLSMVLSGLQVKLEVRGVSFRPWTQPHLCPSTGDPPVAQPSLHMVLCASGLTHAFWHLPIRTTLRPTSRRSSSPPRGDHSPHRTPLLELLNNAYS